MINNHSYGTVGQIGSMLTRLTRKLKPEFHVTTEFKEKSLFLVEEPRLLHSTDDFCCTFRRLSVITGCNADIVFFYVVEGSKL